MPPEQFHPENQEGRSLLDALSEAMLKKDRAKLRLAVDNLQNAVDEKKMCTPMPDYALEELLKTGKEVLYVGTGSAGERIYIENGMLSMPVSEDDERRGYGKRVQSNFRKLFNIPAGQELKVSFTEIGNAKL